MNLDSLSRKPSFIRFSMSFLISMIYNLLSVIQVSALSVFQTKVTASTIQISLCCRNELTNPLNSFLLLETKAKVQQSLTCQRAQESSEGVLRLFFNRDFKEQLAGEVMDCTLKLNIQLTYLSHQYYQAITRSYATAASFIAFAALFLYALIYTFGHRGLSLFYFTQFLSFAFFNRDSNLDFTLYFNQAYVKVLLFSDQVQSQALFSSKNYYSLVRTPDLWNAAILPLEIIALVVIFCLSLIFSNEVSPNRRGTQLNKILMSNERKDLFMRNKEKLKKSGQYAMRFMGFLFQASRNILVYFSIVNLVYFDQVLTSSVVMSVGLLTSFSALWLYEAILLFKQIKRSKEVSKKFTDIAVLRKLGKDLQEETIMKEIENSQNNVQRNNSNIIIQNDRHFINSYKDGKLITIEQLNVNQLHLHPQISLHSSLSDLLHFPLLLFITLTLVIPSRSNLSLTCLIPFSLYEGVQIMQVNCNKYLRCLRFLVQLGLILSGILGEAKQQIAMVILGMVVQTIISVEEQLRTQLIDDKPTKREVDKRLQELKQLVRLEEEHNFKKKNKKRRRKVAA